MLHHRVKGWLPRILLEILKSGIAQQRDTEAVDIWGGTGELRGGLVCLGHETLGGMLLGVSGCAPSWDGSKTHPCAFTRGC